MRTRTVAVLAVVALVLLAACTRESNENTNEGINPSGGVAVEVRLTDDAIEMPDEIPSGQTAFEVTNSGTTAHGFAIEGVDDQLEGLLVDQLEVLRVDLEPGTYTVYSPEDGDREAGLEWELTVTEASPSEGAPLRDDAVGPSDEQDELGDEGN